MADSPSEIPAVQDSRTDRPISCAGRRWIVADADGAEIASLAAAAHIPNVIARLLWVRGIRSANEALAFLSPSLDQMHDPLLLSGMAAAVERIVMAVRSRESLLIYGDYDVDGTLATVLLKTAIDRITPKGTPSLVRYHIPHRIREGYGVQGSVLADAAASGIRLVVSVDTGIRAFAAAHDAKALGLDLIVTDHHLPEGATVPEAIAVVNPNQAECSYPEKHLCGAAVAYKLAEALLMAAGEAHQELQLVDPSSLQRLRLSLLKLVAIATIADAVPLTGENRAIAALGLAELRDIHQLGLRELMRLAEVGGDGRAPTSQEIGFRIAPRINAAGRMDVAGDVVSLLLTRKPEEAEELAAKLHRLNEERRTTEANALLDVTKQIEALASTALAETPAMYVLDGRDWHRGVIGILASRVVERTSKPALIITHDDGTAHGSGRSVEGFHLLDAITTAHAEHHRETSEELFLRFGGHAHAVGFSLRSERVEALRSRMGLLATAKVAAFAEPPALKIDAELTAGDIHAKTWGWVNRMQPCGNGNPEPVFFTQKLTVLDVRTLKGRHTKMRLRCSSGATLDCVGWARLFEWPQQLAVCDIYAGALVDIAYKLRWNDHRDFGGVEVQLCDLRLSSSSGPDASVT